MYKIGHRGAAGYEIENTARSIQKALELDVDMIELDVRMCKTGELVVFHDKSVERITNGYGQIKKLNLEQLRMIRTIDGQKILTLTEALDLIAGRCWVNLDIKTKNVSLALMSVLYAAAASGRWKLRQFLISSFLHGELARIRALEPRLRIGLLYFRRVKSALVRAKQLDAYSVHFHIHHFSPTVITELHHLNIKSFVWTVNNALDMRRAYQLGVDGIISDYPDVIRAAKRV